MINKIYAWNIRVGNNIAKKMEIKNPILSGSIQMIGITT